MDNRITIDPQVYHGQACIKGTRLPVHQILRMLANGDTIEDLLQEYPSSNMGRYPRLLRLCSVADLLALQRPPHRLALIAPIPV